MPALANSLDCEIYGGVFDSVKVKVYPCSWYNASGRRGSTRSTMLVHRVCLLPLGLLIVLLEAASMGTRVTFLQEPSAAYVKRYLEQQDDICASTNHQFAGFTAPTSADGDGAAPPRPPSGFQERTVRVRLGSGKRTYERGREALLRWRMHDGSSWARIKLGRRPKRSNSQLNMVTVAKACAGMTWCINPCLVLYEHKDTTLRFLAPPGTDPHHPLHSPNDTPTRTHGAKQEGWLWAGGSPTSAPRWASFLAGSKHKGKQSAVAYTTKEGHFIQGEERMRVLWFCGRGGDDSVWFEVYSVSRGAGFVGGVVFPFVQSMQRRFFREQAETMRQISS